MKMRYYQILIIFLLLVACKKNDDKRNSGREVLPSLTSVKWTANDSDTIAHIDLFYDSSGGSLTRLNTIYKSTVNHSVMHSYLYTQTGFSMKGEMIYNSEGIPGRVLDILFELDENNRIISGSRESFRQATKYEYNGTGYLKKISRFINGDSISTTEFHYSREHILDSVSIYNNNSGSNQKTFVIEFEYDNTRRNSIGNYFMMLPGRTARELNATGKFGQEQKYITTKETEYVYNNTTKIKIRDFDYENINNNAGLLIQRKVRMKKYNSTTGQTEDTNEQIYYYNYDKMN